MEILISKNSIDEAKKRIGDDPFIFKNDFLKIIKEEQPDLLLWTGNYSKVKFTDDSISNNWFAFAITLIFVLFDFEIFMYKKFEKKIITKEIIEGAYKSFKSWNEIEKFYINLKEKEPFLFVFSEQLKKVAKELQNQNRDKVKHEDVFMVGICYTYKVYELMYES